MEIDWILVLAAIMVAAGFVGSLLPLLPGVPLLFSGLLLAAWEQGFSKVSVLTMVVIGVLGVAAWAVDFFGSMVTAKKAGASKQAMWGVAIGAVLGIFGGIPGLILGPAIGAIVGELIAHQDKLRATTVGLAAGLGFILAMVAKVFIVVIMLIVFTSAYFV